MKQKTELDMTSSTVQAGWTRFSQTDISIGQMARERDFIYTKHKTLEDYRWDFSKHKFCRTISPSIYNPSGNLCNLDLGPEIVDTPSNSEFIQVTLKP